jgi:hypothetical protein
MRLWDVVTGKAAMENRLTKYISGDSDLNGLGVEGTLRAWGVALIWSVNGAVKGTLINRYPQWREKTKDRVAVRRLACYFGWLLSERAIERNPQWFRDESGVEDDLSAKMRVDFVWVRDSLFPPDGVTQAAINRNLIANEGVAAHVIEPSRALQESLNAVEECLGLPLSQRIDDLSMKKDISLAGVIVSGINAVGTYFDIASRSADAPLP